MSVVATAVTVSERHMPWYVSGRGGTCHRPINDLGPTVKSTHQARNLGVVIDSDLNFKKHIQSITKSAYYHLKNISRIKGLMSQQDYF